ncbi:hypothetical protein IMG5_195520, partial [Ichthyophthirius multifiliis]
TIKCQNTENYLNLEQLTISMTIFECLNIRINTRKDLILQQEIFFGFKQRQQQQSVQNYVFLESNQYIKINANITHMDNYLGILIFIADKNIYIEPPKTDIYNNIFIKSGHIGLQTNEEIILKNSFFSANFIRCDDDLNFSMKKKSIYSQLFELFIDKQTGKANLVFKKQEKNSKFKIVYQFLQTDFTLLFLAEKNISMDINTTIKASKIGLFSLNIASNGNLNSTGMGCQPNNGKGKGLYYNTEYQCAAHGAHHAGYGGIGLPQGKLEADVIEQYAIYCIKYFNYINFIFKNNPYDYQNMFFEGSGGSCQNCSEKIEEKKEGEGAGGGVVIIYGVQQVQLGGKVESNGQKFWNVKGSGGSGGSILIKSNIIQGNAQLMAQGGDSDDEGLFGEGSGGKIQIDQQNCIGFFDLNQKIQQFNGIINVQSGFRKINNQLIKNELFLQIKANNGVFIPQICQSEYEPNINGGCDLCKQGYYKTSSFGSCKKV